MKLVRQLARENSASYVITFQLVVTNSLNRVKTAINTETGEQVALKILSRQRIDKAAMDRLRKEVI